MMYTNNTYRKSFAKDPAVIKYKNKYYLYHSVWISANVLGIGIATSDNLDTWTDIGSVPASQECEKTGIGAPAAIVIDGIIHLFYQTYGTGEKDAICHAVSTDGINFIKDSTNPVYRPTNDWCIGRAIDADVCIFKDKLFLYIATRDHKMEVQKLGVAYASLTSGFSRNTWIQGINQSVLVPEMKWEGKCIEAPATIVVNDRIYLFYGGSYNCEPQQIGCAVSEDGIYFKRVMNTPFIPCGKAGSWNSDESGHPYVFKDDDGRIFLFYQGTNDMGKTWYISKQEIAFINNKPVVITCPLATR